MNDESLYKKRQSAHLFSHLWFVLGLFGQQQEVSSQEHQGTRLENTMCLTSGYRLTTVYVQATS